MGTSSTTKTESKPPEWSIPAYKMAGQEAIDLYNSGAGGNVYQGSTVAGLSDTTMGGINSLATAGANTNTAGTRPLFEGLGAASVGPSYSEQNLAEIASGADNPYFERALEGQLGKTASQVQSQFAGAGRYGSGANQGVLTNELGSIRSDALSNQWNQNIQNQLAATGQMDASRNAGLDRALSATGQMSAQDQQQFQNALTGAGATLQAGGLLDTQAQKQLTDQVNQWYETDNADWTRLGLLEQAAAGSAGPYGTQNSRTSSSNPLGAIGAIGSAIPKK